MLEKKNTSKNMFISIIDFTNDFEPRYDKIFIGIINT